MLVDYFHSCVRARSLDIATQIKNMGAPLLVFACIYYDIYAIIFLVAFRKIRDCVMEEEEFEDLKD
jgi:hypothetical protein